MKIFLMIILVALAAVPDAFASSIPPEFSYTVYIEGKDAGKSVTKFTKTPDRLVFDSSTKISFAEYTLELTTRTEADPITYEILKFAWDGARTNYLLGGEAVAEGDSVHGFVVENGIQYPHSRNTKHPRTMVLEDYVACHQLLIGLGYFQEGVEEQVIDLFLPTSFMVNDALVVKSSEALIESDIDEALCIKVQVHMTGAAAYVMFFDQKRGMPVYIAFPGTNAEVFLDEFFGDTPVSRFR